MPPKPVNVIERIERRANELRDGECWETNYRGGNAKGHKLVQLDCRIPMYLHRIAWEAHNAEPIPEGLMVCHSCDNPRCFNPEHLFLGTAKDNTQDMLSKQRGRHQ